jgi:ribosomal protein S12 methylthiotransferase accessory factor YcaO
MNVSDATIQRLTELLERDEPILLNADERSLIRAALVGLAAAERRAAHLERLLEAQGVALDAADRAAAEALSTIGAKSEAPDYDFTAADTARRELLEKIESANSAREVVAAALAFAKDIAIIAG